MVQDGVADDDVERRVVVGDLLGVGHPAVDVEAEASALRSAAATMPGERSVTLPRAVRPACMRLSRKNPVPQPSSSARP